MQTSISTMLEELQVIIGIFLTFAIFDRCLSSVQCSLYILTSFFLYLLLPIRAHKSTVMSRNNDQQVRHILKSIILLCASHLSLSSSHRLGFFARTGTATLARPLERLIVNLVLSLLGSRGNLLVSLVEKNEADFQHTVRSSSHCRNELGDSLRLSF